jgi:hypothetical protein
MKRTAKAMRGRIALQKHFVRTIRDGCSLSRKLWECARVLASLFAEAACPVAKQAGVLFTSSLFFAS